MPTYVWSANSAGTSSTWGTWVQNGTTTASTNTLQDTVWLSWQDATGSPVVIVRAAPVRASTPEEIAERQRRADAQLQQLEREREARARAQKRARVLLLRFLSREQRREYREHKHFHVVSEHGNRYRIDHGSAGNVHRPDLGRRYCIHPDGVPAEDAMLAQKLLLETDEARFLQVANASAA